MMKPSEIRPCVASCVRDVAAVPAASASTMKRMITCERRTVYTSSRRSPLVNVAIHVGRGARALGRAFQREATSVGVTAAVVAGSGAAPDTAPELAGTLGGGLLGVRI